MQDALALGLDAIQNNVLYCLTHHHLRTTRNNSFRATCTSSRWLCNLASVSADAIPQQERDTVLDLSFGSGSQYHP